MIKLLDYYEVMLHKWWRKDISVTVKGGGSHIAIILKENKIFHILNILIHQIYFTDTLNSSFNSKN